MSPKPTKKKSSAQDIATVQYTLGYDTLQAHPMFTSLLFRAQIRRTQPNHCGPNEWAVVTNGGEIHVHPTRRGEPSEWMYVLAHCLLHLGFGHFQERPKPLTWNLACDLFITRFLSNFKLGRPPEAYEFPFAKFTATTEEQLYLELCEQELPVTYCGDMLVESEPLARWRKTDWPELLGKGLAQAVTSAVYVAAGYGTALGAPATMLSEAQQARNWFVNSFPLLGALASAFTVIEDPILCVRMGIAVAAVSPESREIYINSAAGLSTKEYRFVMAHELLHVGLRHDTRQQGRDPYLWNVACDFVINAWLVEMGIGDMPEIGILYDPTLKDLSAESIYDRIVTNMRYYRKLRTLRGVALSDILDPKAVEWWQRGAGVDLDAFYRSALGQGLNYYEEQGRDLFPAGLIEEIRALSQPPIPWDVELAQWFDEHFPTLEKVRTYARPSRRQSATPDIPRPTYVPPPEAATRTFGVVLDTSGSMARETLAKALGAIASYSFARDVAQARVIFCDATAYDQGYMSPYEIADRVKVKGRGGTILQPGIDLLEQATDFPKGGPILIITDGFCDKLRIEREHAFLLPEGRSLPFVALGKVFRIR